MRQAAGVLVIRADGKILAFKRAKDDGFQGFGVPGGKLDEGETLYEAACRECKEETGLTVTAVAKMPAFTDVDDTGAAKFTTFKVVVEGEISHDRPHEGIAEWIDVETLLNGPFSGYNRKMLTHFEVIQ